MQPLVPCLWFDSQAEEAAKYYTSIFKGSKLGKITHYTRAGKEVHGRDEGSVMTVEFELNGQPFVALNGGPSFKFNEALSFQIPCQSQEELDWYWNSLSQGGDERAQQCGWLKDKFGLSWQVVPEVLPTLLRDTDPVKAQRVMAAVLSMKKIDIAALQRAYDGE